MLSFFQECVNFACTQANTNLKLHIPVPLPVTQHFSFLYSNTSHYFHLYFLLFTVLSANHLLLNTVTEHNTLLNIVVNWRKLGMSQQTFYVLEPRYRIHVKIKTRRGLRYSKQWRFKMWSSGLWPCVVMWHNNQRLRGPCCLQLHNPKDHDLKTKTRILHRGKVIYFFLKLGRTCKHTNSYTVLEVKEQLSIVVCLM